jgi:folate-binding protein YgfZ
MPDALTVQTRPAAVLRVSGEDAPTYLQSQCSRDLRGLAPGQVRYGLWLDRKGKVHADSLIFCLEPEVFILLSPYCPAQTLAAKLEDNIIADEVEIEDLTADALTVVEIGLPATDVPDAGTFSTKQAGEGSVPVDELCFAGRRSMRPCRETLWLHGLPDGENAPSSEDDVLARERILAGIPAVPQDIGPGDLPQEGGLEKDAVSFNKGCYLGQEVMARLHAMGRTQRALHRVTLDKLPASLPAEVLDAEGKAVGELRSVAACADGVIGLAMLKKRALGEESTFTLTGGERVEIGEALV